MNNNILLLGLVVVNLTMHQFGGSELAFVTYMHSSSSSSDSDSLCELYSTMQSSCSK